MASSHAISLVPCADCRYPVSSQPHCPRLRPLISFHTTLAPTRLAKYRLRKKRQSVRGLPHSVGISHSNIRFIPRASSGNADSNDFQGREDEAQSNDVEADEPNAAPSFLQRFKASLASGTRRYMSGLPVEIERGAGVDVKALQRAYGAIHSYLQEKRQELAPRVSVAQKKANDYSSQAVKGWDVVRLRYWPQFLSWNRWELWKDRTEWDAQRCGALIMYILVIAASIRGLHTVFVRPRIIKRLANAYMEAVIPPATPQNLRKLRKAMQKEEISEGVQTPNFAFGPYGNGETARIESDDKGLPSSLDESKEKNLNGAHGQKQESNNLVDANSDEWESLTSEASARMSWQERLEEWDKMLQLENFKQDFNSQESDFIIPTNLEALKKELLKKREKQKFKRIPRAYLFARKWWQYRPKLPYMYFLFKVRNFEVEEAVYTEDLRRLFVTMKEGFPADYTVDVPVDPYLYDLMKNCNVEIDVLPRRDGYYYLRALAVLVPSLVILYIIRRYTVHMLEASSEKIIDLLKMDREHLILPEDAAEKATSEYKDVVISDTVWETLEEIMAYMKEPMRYYSKKLIIPRGILISGPPGTGKTLLARALARESGHPFVFASGAEFVESGAEDGSEKVFNIFFTARANAPSFIFIDEIDALAGKGLNDDPERKATFEQLLTELDGLPEDTDVDRFSLRQAVVLICATNRAEELDDRLLQQGRIDREIYIGLPGEEERVGIFKVHSANRRLAKDVDFSKFVFRTVGCSGADIRNLINEAGIMAVRRGREEICQQDFEDVLNKQLFEGLGMVLTDEEQARAEQKVSVERKRLLAVHEAGHILLSHLFPRFDWHAFTHLLPGGKEAALSVFYPRQEMLGKGYTTVGYLKMQMVVAHGGRCAEQIVFGDDITDGGQDDLAKISKIAREIAISFASPRLGLFPMLWKDKFDPPLPTDEQERIPNNWSKPGNRITNMSMELSEMFTREVTRYVDETEEEAMKGLLTNRHILDRIVIELLDRTKMSGLDIAEMIRSMNPTMLTDPLERPDIEFDLQEQPDPPNIVGRYEYLDIYQAPLHSC